MRRVARNGISYLSGLSVLVVAPLYFIYQSMVQVGLLEPILKGFFTAAMIATLPLLVVSAFARFKVSDFVRRGTFLLYAVFMLMLFILSVFASISKVNADITYYIQLSFVRFVYMFLLALALVRMRAEFSRFLYYFVIGYSVFVLFSSSGGFVRPAVWYGEYLFEFDYQQIAFCYLAFSMVLLPSLGLLRRYFYYLFVVPALYLIGARSEFFAFIFLLGIIEVAKNWRVFSIISSFGLLVAVVILAASDMTILKDTRMFSVFFDGADLSVDARTTFAASAYQQIAENPVLGGFASHPPGEYIHNMLAVWVDLGLLGFVIYLSMLVLPLCALLYLSFVDFRRPDWLRAFCFVSVTLFLLVFAKTYTYGLVPMAIAVYCVYRSGSTSEALKSRLEW
ncbi:MAG: hypothetical protein RSD81_04755 [Pseudomonas sp.]